MTLDLAIRGGTTVVGGREVVADIGVRYGRIVAIGDVGRATRDVPAHGAVVLPGAVDPHVHLNSDWPFADERRPAEDFRSGTRSAAAGGVTTVGDFAYVLPGMSLTESIVEIERRAAATSSVDVFLHAVITSLTTRLREECVRLVHDGIRSFKFYPPLPDFSAHREGYDDLMRVLAGLGAVGMFHCEDPALGTAAVERQRQTGDLAVRRYPDTKPAASEEAASDDILASAVLTGLPTYLVHVSTRSVLEAVGRARAAGARVWVETRPIYLHLTVDRYDTSDDAEAARYVGTPPLRTAEDRASLWRSLQDGTVDVVATDHVGFTTEQKYRPGDTLETVPKGMPNLETMVPMLYSEGVVPARITLARLAHLVAEAPARIFGLYPRKGVIEVGADADLCILDPGETRTLADGTRHGAADLEVYRGFKVTGWPVMTIAKGDVIFESGEVTASPGRGHVLRARPQGAG